MFGKKTDLNNKSLLQKIVSASSVIKESLYSASMSLYYYKTIKLYLCNHLTVGIKYLKTKNTMFPHPVGIVIGKNVSVGFNCVVYQNVTIGTKETKNFQNAVYPTIGNNVTIFANAVIFGAISIGDNSTIGAGSVVFKNVPANSIVAGNPATIISKNSQLSDRKSI